MLLGTAQVLNAIWVTMLEMTVLITGVEATPALSVLKTLRHQDICRGRVISSDTCPRNFIADLRSSMFLYVPRADDSKYIPISGQKHFTL